MNNPLTQARDEDVHVTPVLIDYPALLNLQGVHQSLTPTRSSRCTPPPAASGIHSNTHLGTSPAAMTPVAAAVPDPACGTQRPWPSEDDPHEFDGGELEFSDAPGLGIALDPTAPDARPRRRLGGDVRERDDVSAMRAVDPAWQVPILPRR